MIAGCFGDIRQQDGSLVRMKYPLTKDNYRLCVWVTIRAADADKYPDFIALLQAIETRFAAAAEAEGGAGAHPGRGRLQLAPRTGEEYRLPHAQRADAHRPPRRDVQDRQV